MSIVLWILAAAVVAALLVLRWRHWRRDRANVAAASAELRRAVLDRTLGGVLKTGPPDAINAVVMDWTLAANSTATLAAMSDDTTSLYLSQGGGVVGAGEHESVRRAATQFREIAAGVRAHFHPTDDLSPPPAGYPRFFLITPAATLATLAVPTDELATGHHDLAPLGNAAQEVITEISSV